MKIAIIGAHRVGKTTLAEKLQEHLTDHELSIEPYYALEESGYEFAEIPTVDDFIEMLMYSVKQVSKSGGNVIFDRCPIDILAYIEAIDARQNTPSLYNQVQRAIDHIDLLVFVPIETPDLITCQESDLPALRYQVDEILQDWIWDLDLEIIAVKGTLMNRLDQILHKISQ